MRFFLVVRQDPTYLRHGKAETTVLPCDSRTVFRSAAPGWHLMSSHIQHWPNEELLVEAERGWRDRQIVRSLIGLGRNSRLVVPDVVLTPAASGEEQA
jgi:hypothetical protein